MTLTHYQDGIDAGLNKREAGLYALSQDMGQWAREVREREERFAASLGTTREELQNAPVEIRDEINEQFAKFEKGECASCPWRNAMKVPRVVPRCRERGGKPCVGTVIRRKECDQAK